MYLKKALCATILSTLLFPTVYNIEYVDAAEWIDEAVYSVDIVVDTVEIDINDVPEDRRVKVGFSLYNSPGINAIIFILEKDSRIEFSEFPEKVDYTMGSGVGYLATDIQEIQYYYGSMKDDLMYDGCFGYYEFILPENIEVGDWFSINILKEYLYKSYESSNGVLYSSWFRLKNIDTYMDYSYNNLNITNGGIRITGSGQPQTDLPQTEQPQTDLPQTEQPQTDTSQIDSSQTTSTTTELTTTTITTTTTTTSSSVTTTSKETTPEVTTKSIETSEVIESNNNEKKKSNLPLILSVLASLGILGGIFGFIIKKSKGHGGKPHE